MAKKVTFKIGRSAIDGLFKTVKAAQEQPRTSVVETITRKKK